MSRCEQSLAAVWTACALTVVGCGAEVASQVVDVTSASGALIVTATPRPDPPVAGNNAVELAFVRADGTELRVEQLGTIDVHLWMPSHGHGVSNEPVVALSSQQADEGAVVVELTDVRYAMAGLWQLRVAVVVDGVEESFVVPQRVQ